MQTPAWKLLLSLFLFWSSLAHSAQITFPEPPWLFGRGTRAVVVGDSMSSPEQAITSTGVPISWAEMLAQQRGWSLTNRAVSGVTIAKMATFQAMVQTVSPGDVGLVLVGHNDFLNHLGSAPLLAQAKRILRSVLIHLAIPDSQKAFPGTVGQTAITLTGGWTAYPGIYSLSGPVASGHISTTGSTGTYAFRGPVLYTCYSNWSQTGIGTSTLDVNIDGTGAQTVHDGTGTAVVDMTSLYWPECVAFRGLTAGAHSAVVTATMAGGQIAVLDYLATPSNAPVARPVTVIVGSPVDFRTGIYTAYGSARAHWLAYKSMIEDLVAELQGDGLRIFLASTDVYDPDKAHVAADLMHANVAGYTALRDGFLYTIAGLGGH